MNRTTDAAPIIGRDDEIALGRAFRAESDGSPVDSARRRSSLL
jgi:hypothetical protein